jgi:hypothetical protein
MAFICRIIFCDNFMKTICTPTPKNCIKLFYKLWLFAFLLAFTRQASATIRYVRDGATGSGASWSDASGDLQAMINASSSGDEIRVAGGNYQNGGAYSMKEGVKIYGNYVGMGPYPDVRDRTYYPSTLSGNGTGAVIYNNNNGLTAAALLDGFIITNGGNSGVSNITASPAFTNCTFTNNSAVTGGGMYNYQNASPILTNCSFFANTASSYGGGMYNEAGSSPALINCTF